MAGTKIRTVSFQGKARVARADGLLLSQEAERVFGVEIASPMGGKPIPMVMTQRLDVRRIEETERK
jgi:hypothetical protein